VTAATFQKANPNPISIDRRGELRPPGREQPPDSVFKRCSSPGILPYWSRNGHDHRVAIRHGSGQGRLQTPDEPERYPIETQARLLHASQRYGVDGDPLTGDLYVGTGLTVGTW